MLRILRGMRLCHFSDSHLGAGETHFRRGTSGLTLRQEDIVNSFVQAVDRIIELRPDICIHSGDLFNSVRPANKILAIAGQQLYRLAARHHIPTVVIAGNHDTPKQSSVSAALQIYSGIENLYVAAGCNMAVFIIGEAKVFAVPHSPDLMEMKEGLRLCEPDRESRFNLLVAHGVAAGLPQFSMAELGEQELDTDALGSFDYTALGHFHDFTRVAPRVYYAGSTDRLSQAERTAAKGVVEVSLEPFEVTFHELDTRPMVDVLPIDATGLRGDKLAEAIRTNLEAVGAADKIVRLTIAGVTTETLKTLPPQFLREVRQQAYSLDIRFERAVAKQELPAFGRTAIGRLDDQFMRYLDKADLKGLDRKRLSDEGLKYLSAEE